MFEDDEDNNGMDFTKFILGDALDAEELKGLN